MNERTERVIDFGFLEIREALKQYDSRRIPRGPTRHVYGDKSVQYNVFMPDRSRFYVTLEPHPTDVNKTVVRFPENSNEIMEHLASIDLSHDIGKNLSSAKGAVN